MFAGTKRTWRAKSGHRGLGKNNLTVAKHARNIFCLDFKVTCTCIRKDSPPDSPGARSPTTVREASEKMTSVQEDTASHCHDCHDAVASVSCHPKRACGQVVASKFSEVSTPVAMKFWFVLQAQSEPGEQHPVTEDWKENVL